MSIYDEMKPVATALLAEFKQGIITLLQLVPGTGAADEPGAAVESSYTLNATVKGAPFKYVKDGFAVATDLLVTAAIIEGVTPSKNDFIVIDGERCKIIEDLSVPAAGVKVVWKFLVRK